MRNFEQWCKEVEELARLWDFNGNFVEIMGIDWMREEFNDGKSPEEVVEEDN